MIETIELIDMMVEASKLENKKPKLLDAMNLATIIRYLNSLSGEELAALMFTVSMFLSFISMVKLHSIDGDKSAVMLAVLMKDAMTEALNNSTGEANTVPRMLTGILEEPYVWSGTGQISKAIN